MDNCVQKFVAGRKSDQRIGLINAAWREQLPGVVFRI
jgi:hypothetical protein